MSLRYLSTAQAAEIIGVGQSTMQTYVAEGQIRYTDIGRNGRPRVRISEADLQQFMEKRSRIASSGSAA